MTRKDYQLIAEALRSSIIDYGRGGRDGRAQWEATVRRMAQVLANENARFNVPTFLQACGYTGPSCGYTVEAL